MEPEDKPAEEGNVREPVVALCERLRVAREKSGFSISEIAERTRIPARHLSALEEGRFQDLPAVAYSAGFARSFAQAVGLNGSELAAQYRAEASPDPLPYYAQHESLDPARVPSSGLAWLAAGAGAIIVAILIAFSMGVFSRGGDNVTTVAAAPEPAPIPQSEDATDPLPAAAPQPVETTAPAPANGGGQQVILSATEDAWIKVYDRSGQTVRMGILKANENYVVPGDPNQLLLWTGKAGAVRVMVGGKAVAPLGKPVQTVRDVSLAPARLLARGQTVGSPSPAGATGATPPPPAVASGTAGR